MAEMEYFCCFNSYRKKTRNLSDSEVGRLFRSLMDYNATGEKPQLAGREAIAFDFIVEDIDAAKEKYAARCEQNRANRTKQTSMTVDEREQPLTNADENDQTKNKKQKTKDSVMMMMNTREDKTTEPGNDAQACFECYEQNIGTMSRAVYDEINAYLQQLPADLVCEAIQEAARNNARSWKYAETILRGCLQKNILTKAAYLSEQEARKSKTSSRQSAGQRRSTQETLRRIAKGESDDVSADGGAPVAGYELLG